MPKNTSSAELYYLEGRLGVVYNNGFYSFNAWEKTKAIIGRHLRPSDLDKLTVADIRDFQKREPVLRFLSKFKQRHVGPLKFMLETRKHPNSSPRSSSQPLCTPPELYEQELASTNL